ncbi:DNA sulfur modification protein DndE [Streptomyces sp. BPTC-684]|uniref:DNA sulfur modification protein DndE n=1 Tax=Streptomyces sp. BPTC-684 TaxID=3043734 RepID=UPI0024B189A5|nr:DNA sulfur modification protein DndE [Streptomyces sp. BPTC-684]WHM36019.1 DNA sulfur modification protein DndE [Streptomyces sp. BPTC-684]
MSLENIRLATPSKDRLVRLKRTTGISQWNVLCRWALALSLADASTPLVKDIVTDSNVEMSWKTFAGQHGDLYLALLKQRCVADGLEPTDENVSKTLTIHLARGIGYLGAHKEMTTVEGLISSTAR